MGTHQTTKTRFVNVVKNHSPDWRENPLCSQATTIATKAGIALRNMTPIEHLKNGGTLLYPSDTIWGLGCDATNEAACQKIMHLKNRPAEKSFIVLVDSIQQLEKFVPDFHEVCYDLIEWSDRPLTIIYPAAKGIAPSVLAADGSIAIRVTKDPICLQLIRGLRQPIVSTSANLSGEKIPTCFDEIAAELKNGVDAIVNERLTEKMTTPSQIIKIGIDGSVKIIRP